YQTMAIGDYITVTWDNDLVKELLIDINTEINKPIIFSINKNVDIGSHAIFYTVVDIAGNQESSKTLKIEIVNENPSEKYPSPIFIDATDGKITQDSINSNRGTHVLVAPNSNILAKDKVTLFWSGFNSKHQLINNDTYSKNVTQEDVINGVGFLIEFDKLEPLIGGTATAYYNVERDFYFSNVRFSHKVSKSSIVGISNSACVEIVPVVLPTQMKMRITTGAVNYDFNAVHVTPFNRGVIKGSPGTELTLFTSGQDIIFDETGDSLYNAILDEEGSLNFKLKALHQGGATITAYETNHPDVQVVSTINFGPYTMGTGNIKYINHTTGAPNDGITPCSFYMQVNNTADMNITKAKVHVSGNALIDGYISNTADILLNDDKSATIDIVNSYAEEVVVTIFLPESSGSLVRSNIVFSDF
ncbi:hypothetical protein, partial [Aeromonas sp. HMWF016]|uniref:hypothetical protein n=1 Tax=Aeromonas sp. HMWF016 TaxID=2056852 RepID=UPI0015E80BB4